MRRIFVLAGLALLTCGPLPTAGAGGRTPPRCAMAGTVLVRTSLIRVVARETNDGVVVRGCAFRTNRVRVLDRAAVSPRVEKRAGTWVALRAYEPSGVHEGAVKVADARSGRTYRVSDTVDTRHGALRYFINELGQAVAAQRVSSPPPAAFQQTVSIVAFTSRGVQRVVDQGSPAEIPLESLLLDRRLFVWTHSDHVRYAFLTG